MIDTLLFDLDNTLLDFDKAEANAITRALGDVGISVTNEMRDCYHKINLAQWKLLEQGKMTREEVKMRRFKLLFQEFDMLLYFLHRPIVVTCRCRDTICSECRCPSPRQ